jgi:SAM-dependent methyltransferase
MVDAAAARTAAWSQVVVRRGDVQHVELADGSVDRARTDRVLQHVDDPARTVAEIGRVLRRGGRVVFAEPDWDTLVIDHPDLTLARRYTRFVADHVFRHGSIGRQLPGLVVRSGLALEKVLPSTVVFQDVQGADRVLGLERVTGRAVAAGSLTEREAADWLAHLAEQPFFASATLFITVATKPAGSGAVATGSGGA